LVKLSTPNPHVSQLLRLQNDPKLPAIEKWLHDSVIDAYLEILRESQAWSDVLLLNSKFHDKFVKEGYENVRTWSVKRKKGKVKVRNPNYNRVVAPVNVEKNHWIALAADFENRIVLSMDSFQRTVGRVERDCWSGLRKSGTAKVVGKGEFDPSAWDSREFKVPEQGNIHDCGVFACMNIQFWVDRREFTFKQKDMPRMRRAMAWSILHRKVTCV